MQNNQITLPAVAVSAADFSSASGPVTIRMNNDYPAPFFIWMLPRFSLQSS